MPQHARVSIASVDLGVALLSRDLGTLPGATDAVATAINNLGKVVGFGPDVDGLGVQAIMWIPVKSGGR